MTEQAVPDQAECSALSVQMPETLHIDLPQLEPEEVCVVINKCLTRIKTENWKIISDGFMTCTLMTELANYCMDIIQTLSEAILDVVLPQVYRYMKTYGTFSSTVLGLTEDRIHIYLGDSIEQALAKCLSNHVPQFVSTKVFSQLLLRHIAKTVNSVLALSTQTPIQESKLPLLFVSGCLTSIKDLRDTASQLAMILLRAHRDQQPAQMRTQPLSCLAALGKDSSEEKSPVVWFTGRHELNDLLRTYIIRMVKVLRSKAQMSYCQRSKQRDVCIRVGTNAQILTVEDSESHGQQSAMSSCSGLTALPGAMPDSNKATSYRSCSFNTVTKIAPTECQLCYLGPAEMESIENIVNELVQDFLATAQPDSGGLEVVDKVKLRELTDRLFDVVMSGRVYQIQLVPTGTRMCDTVMYKNPRRGDVTNPGIVTHTLYMRTEEFVHRCAMQVLLWLALNQDRAFCPSSHSSDEWYEGDGRIIQRAEAGDCASRNSVYSSDESFVTDEIPEQTQSEFLQATVIGYMFSLLIAELLINIGIRDKQLIHDTISRTVFELPDQGNLDVDVHISLMGRNHNDISQAALHDLLLEFGSARVMLESVTSGDPSFREAIARAFKRQLTCPASPVPCGNTAKKTTCSFFKKFKRLCRKKSWKTTCQTSTVISPISDQDNSKLQDEDKSLKDQREQHRCPLMRRIAASTRNICSSSKKMFSAIARALGRPFIACFRPEIE